VNQLLRHTAEAVGPERSTRCGLGTLLLSRTQQGADTALLPALRNSTLGNHSDQGAYETHAAGGSTRKAELKYFTLCSLVRSNRHRICGVHADAYGWWRLDPLLLGPRTPTFLWQGPRL